MPIEKKLSSIKRFGPRYGRKVKEKLAKIEEEQRRLHRCPYCSHTKVKRLAAGIWYCRKCKTKFTGKAYSVKKKIRFEEEAGGES
ncbi:50S ribosomal protein L37ae [Candidatus Woesearchaeota archaeon]|nr:50S ribosomal protein L37ae [Candidatus Woesearchaeota archaeon]